MFLKSTPRLFIVRTMKLGEVSVKQELFTTVINIKRPVVNDCSGQLNVLLTSQSKSCQSKFSGRSV